MKTFFKIDTWHKPKLVHPDVWFWLYALLRFSYLKSQWVVHSFDSSIVSTILNILSVLVKRNQNPLSPFIRHYSCSHNFLLNNLVNQSRPMLQKVYHLVLPTTKVQNIGLESVNDKAKNCVSVEKLSVIGVYFGEKNSKKTHVLRLWCLFPFSGMH